MRWLSRMRSALVPDHSQGSGPATTGAGGARAAAPIECPAALCARCGFRFPPGILAGICPRCLEPFAPEPCSGSCWTCPLIAGELATDTAVSGGDPQLESRA